MAIVYRFPAWIPPEVRSAFEKRGVRPIPGDAVVYRKGMRPLVMRELDLEIIPFLNHLSVESLGPGDEVPPLPPQGPYSHLKLVPVEKSQSA